MTDLPFVDTHVHFWELKHPTLKWVWLEPDFVHPLMGDIDGLKRRHVPADDHWIGRQGIAHLVEHPPGIFEFLGEAEL